MALAPGIQKTIEAIHGKAQNARIVLMGYPPLLSNDASCLIKIPLVEISPEESQWLNGVADYLAQTMFETADLARKHGVDVGYPTRRSTSSTARPSAVTPKAFTA